MDSNIAKFKLCFDNVGKDLLVEGTNKFSRFFIKLFHRSGNNEITIHIPNSNTGKTSNLNLRKASAANEPNTANDPNATTINGQSGQTHSIRIRKHYRHSKNIELFKKIMEDSRKCGLNLKFRDIADIAKQLGIENDKIAFPKSLFGIDLPNAIDSSEYDALLEIDGILKDAFTENISPEEKTKKLVSFVHSEQRKTAPCTFNPDISPTLTKITDKNFSKFIEDHSRHSNESKNFRTFLSNLRDNLMTPLLMEHYSTCFNFLKEEQLIKTDFPWKENPNLGINDNLKTIQSLFETKISTPGINNANEAKKSFLKEINAIATELNISVSDSQNILEKMNAIVQKSNSISNLDSSTKNRITTLHQFLTYAQEIAKFDVTWNNEIIPWDAKLETLN